VGQTNVVWSQYQQKIQDEAPLVQCSREYVHGFDQ
jgi:hypothetical protein